MSDLVMLVPRREDHGHRDQLWAFCRSQWWNEGWDVFEGHHSDGPFNRSAAINRAAEAAGDWLVAVIVDADVLVHQAAVVAAVEIAAEGCPAVAYDRRIELDEFQTALLLADEIDWREQGIGERSDGVSGAFVIHRELWDKVGGFDEGFVGWGWEDVAFRIAAETMAEQRLRHVESTLVHLWHPPSPEQNHPTLRKNRQRMQTYRQARWRPDLMERLCAR